MACLRWKDKNECNLLSSLFSLILEQKIISRNGEAKYRFDGFAETGWLLWYSYFTWSYTEKKNEKHSTTVDG